MILALLLCGVLADASAALLPSGEWEKIRQVAVNYDLSEEATWLLAAIRRHENGRPGLEFGIGGPMNSGHRAHRYRDGHKSFYIQAMWAAGTVKRHFKGDIDDFAVRYNPGNPDHWAKCIKSIIRRLKIDHKHKLPGAKPAKRKIEYP
ncbi:MAG: hypothetical protein K6F50_02395 [Kiritimatiellae bacterium]|nr:hypothetical protein [Kiritimatiellia bacterium]